jgi:DNA-binding transcriptional LysR family regulator
LEELVKNMQHTDLVGQRLKLQHLKVVMAVAEWGTMARAAKHLSISQPVVSKVIADLEEMLGVVLFDRSPQGVEPTLYGRALVKRSLAVFDDLKASVDEIGFLASPGAGELRLGGTEPLLAFAVIDRLSRQHPRMIFDVVPADRATLLNRELPERRIELAIVPVLSAAIADDQQASVLFQDRLRVVVGMQARGPVADEWRWRICWTSRGAWHGPRSDRRSPMLFPQAA